MRPVSTLLVLAALLPAAETDLPVSAVTLFSSGVGFFEHLGTVQGDASAELRFKTSQINDILKSLVLQDLDGGQVGAVGYPSQDPLDKTLKSFQVDVSGNPPLAQLLNQLRGAKVLVEALDAKLDGIVVGCEQRSRALPNNGGSETRWILNLLVDGAIRPVELDGVRTLKPADPALQAELGKALAALAGARDQDKKPVALSFRGQGQRKVRFGYVVEAPVWKASYRLILGKEGKSHLQGWAIVENPTESDWNDIRLTLVSGRPISFVQDLYKPLYADRPVVATELQAGLRPVAYAGGMPGSDKDRLADRKREEQGKSRNMPFAMKAAAAAPPAPAMALAAAENGFASDALEKSADYAGSVSLATTSVQDQGELFQYTVGKVSIPRQRSAMIPFIGCGIQAERVAIYNRAVLPRNPLAGARLTNSTGNQLSAGPVTVYDDGAYLGDATLVTTTQNQVRLLSYAVDQKLLIDSEKARDDERRSLVRITKGVVEVQVASFTGRTYVADNQGAEDKVLIVEHPRHGGWNLHETPAATETTDNLYRFRLPVAAGKKAELTVTEKLVRSEGISLSDGNADQIAFWLSGQELKPAVKAALIQARTLVDAWRASERAREEEQQAQRAIAEDQERIRRNLQTVQQQSEYGKRLLAKLNEQETKLEQLRLQDEKLIEDIRAKRQALADFVANLTVE